jgi:Helix-turn-helix domain
MSHQGTNWAILQRGLKPTTKIVLWHLCDRYNPDYGCFPSQERLAYDCEISRSTLNLHLIRLETAKLLRRVQRIDPISKRQMSTRYILGFEDGFPPEFEDSEPEMTPFGDQSDEKPCPDFGHGEGPQNCHENNSFSGREDQRPCPETGHGAVSDFDPEPCPKNSQSRVRNSDTNLVREPLRKPVKEEEDARARENLSDDFFGRLLKALGIDPSRVLPAWWQGSSARTHVQRWRGDLGLTEDQILEVAEETRHNHPAPPDGPKALDRAMERAAQRLRAASESTKGLRQGKGAQQAKAGLKASLSEQLVFYADMVNSDRFLPVNAIGNVIRDGMLAKGLVTAERLRSRGVR